MGKANVADSSRIFSRDCTWQAAAGPVNIDLFRALMAAFPTGVTVVTTLDVDGTPRGMTLNAFASVSAEPPLSLICVASQSGTLAAICSTRAFVLNFLAATSKHISDKFASAATASFDDLSWHPSESALGVPVLADHVVANVECLVEQVIQAGDHHIVLGRIVGGRVIDAVPLVFHRRHYLRCPTGPLLAP